MRQSLKKLSRAYFQNNTVYYMFNTTFLRAPQWIGVSDKSIFVRSTGMYRRLLDLNAWK